MQSAIYAPRIYGFLYRLTNRKTSVWLGSLFHSIGKKRLLELWKDERPDLIIHTFPQLAADELRRHDNHGIPTFTVMTDYVLHSRWIHPSTTGYFVASESLKKALSAAGVPDHRISVTGIPLREQFSKPVSREDLCKQYGLDSSRRYVLIMAGAYGVQASVRSMIDVVLKDTECDLIVVCGKNDKLKYNVDAAYGGLDRVRVLAYAERVHELMVLADCMLTKAGGITLTEALALSLPAIVYRPLPGQERGNADYLVGIGAIGVAYRKEQLSVQLRLALDSSHAERMREAMAEAYRGDSAQLICYEALSFDGLVDGATPGIVTSDRKAVSVHV